MSPKRQISLTTELALLGFLRTRPMHGYEIHQCIMSPNGLAGLWQVKLGRLYSLLSRLEAEGLIQAEIEPQGERPPRKVFSLTATGVEAYLAWLIAPVAHPRDIRLNFMLKLHFARIESPDLARRLIARQQARCSEWLAGPLVEMGTLSPDAQSDAVRRYRLGQIEATRDWLAWLAETLGGSN